METAALLHDALAVLGVEVRELVDARGDQADLVLELDGTTITLELEQRSLVDARTAERLLARSTQSDRALMVVADRVTEDARRQLVGAGAGYLDLRGHVGLRTKGVVISADVQPIKQASARTDALAGKAGLEVATRLLMSPAESVAVRALARELGRSPSTVSNVLGALRTEGLVDHSNSVVDESLFWRVAEVWPRRRTYLASAPSSGDSATAHALRLDADPDEVGWALTDTAAAAAYGAPVAFRSGQQLDFFVPDVSVLQRATRLLGTADASSRAAASVRVAPVPATVAQRVDQAGAGDWPLANPLFVALDLAQDAGRGREILKAWNPDERWTRVW